MPEEAEREAAEAAEEAAAADGGRLAGAAAGQQPVTPEGEQGANVLDGTTEWLVLHLPDILPLAAVTLLPT